MEEKYLKVFSLPGNLYVESGPAIITAGSLLKDNRLGTMIAQLKFLNISDRNIIAVKVKLFLYDVAGNLLKDTMEYQYLDVNVARDDSFGDRTAIVLKEKCARSFSVTITEVVFDDKSVWKNIRLPESIHMTALEQKWTGDLVRYYKIKYGNASRYYPEVCKDLWICKCGTINHEGETACCFCRSDKKEIIDDFDYNKFLMENEEFRRKEDERRREWEEKKKEQTAEENRLKAKKKLKRKIILFAAAAIVIAAGAAAGYNYSVSKSNLEKVRTVWENFEEHHPVGSYEYDAYGGTKTIKLVIHVDDFSELPEFEQKKYLRELDAQMKQIDGFEVNYRFYSDGTRFWLKDGELHSK